MPSVKIGPMAYEIVEQRAPRRCSESVFGAVEFDPCQIVLDDRMEPQRRRVTLWHEILHTMFNQMGLEVQNEEQIVTDLGYRLAQFAQDNAGFVREELCAS